jgi:hypothetical protein
VQANFTYVDNQGITNANLTTVSGSGATQQDPLITFTDLPLEGYSPKSYNLVAMFERPKFGARLAWNWRDQYLISQSDCCIKLPIWQDAYGQPTGRCTSVRMRTGTSSSMRRTCCRPKRS